MKNRQNKTDVVSAFVRYQETGQDFASAWVGMEPIVRDFAARHLRKMGVTACGHRGAGSVHEHRPCYLAAEESALDDVVHDTVLVLLKLGGKDAKGRFDREKAKPGISGLRAWLWRVVESQAVNWVRDNRGGRGLTVKTESSLDQGYLADRDQPRSFLEQLAAKPERQDILPILEASIKRLPDPFHGQIVLRKLYDDLSLRQTARAMMVPTSRVQRQIKRALAALKELMERYGIDETELGA